MADVAAEAQETEGRRILTRRAGESSLDYWIEVYAAIILAIATVLTAWSAYQATRWGGVQAISYAQASSARIDSSKEFNLALQRLGFDVRAFTEFTSAYNDSNTSLQEFYETNLFRDEFKAVLDEWIALDPLNNPNAPRNPFSVDVPGYEVYREGLLAETTALENEASMKFGEAQEANKTSNDYVLNTVFFASVIFFAGVSTKFRPVSLRIGMLSIGTLIFLVALIRLLTFPVH